MAIGGGQIRSLSSDKGGSGIVKFPLKLRIGHCLRKNGCAFGSISIAKERNGMPARRRWWPAASLISLGGPVRPTY
jgi:hypothetical protein